MAKTDVKKIFGNSVKVWRHQLGISQEELAERADLHRTYISDVERGARNLSLETMNKLARALDISVSSLFPPEQLPVRKNARNQANGHHQRLVEILLVEDNPDDADLTLRAFKMARFANHVQVVRDGEEALDYLFSRGKYSGRAVSDGLNVILLDLQLPRLSGLEVLRRVRADKRTAHLPVVILTASTAEYDTAECRRLGADSYIVKPVNFQRLSQTAPSLNLEWGLFKWS